MFGISTIFLTTIQLGVFFADKNLKEDSQHREILDSLKDKTKHLEKLTLVSFFVFLLQSSLSAAILNAVVNISIMGSSFFAIDQALQKQGLGKKFPVLSKIIPAILVMGIYTSVFLTAYQTVFTLGVALTIPAIMPQLLFKDSDKIKKAFNNLIKSKSLKEGLANSKELWKALYINCNPIPFTVTLSAVALLTKASVAAVVTLFTTPPLYVAIASITALSFIHAYITGSKNPFTLIMHLYEAAQTLAKPIKSGYELLQGLTSSKKDTPEVVPPPVRNSDSNNTSDVDLSATSSFSSGSKGQPTTRLAASH